MHAGKKSLTSPTVAVIANPLAISVCDKQGYAVHVGNAFDGMKLSRVQQFFKSNLRSLLFCFRTSERLERPPHPQQSSQKEEGVFG